MFSTILILGLILGSSLGIAAKYLKLESDRYQLLGIGLPMILTNFTVLGTALFNLHETHNFMQSLSFAFCAALSFSLMIAFRRTLPRSETQSARARQR